MSAAGEGKDVHASGAKPRRAEHVRECGRRRAIGRTPTRWQCHAVWSKEVDHEHRFVPENATR